MSIRPGYAATPERSEPSSPPGSVKSKDEFASVWDRSRRGSRENATRGTSEPKEGGLDQKRTESGSLDASNVSGTEPNRRNSDSEVHQHTWIAFSSQFSGWTPDRGDGMTFSSWNIIICFRGDCFVDGIQAPLPQGLSPLLF